MAEKLVKTGYANGDSSKPIKLYVTYSYTQDAEKNQTTITCGMYVTAPSSVYAIGPWSDFDGSYVGTSSLTFNGDIPNFAGTRTLASGKKFTVTHNNAGEASATISWQWGVRSTWGGYDSGTNKGSFTITLPTIARKATLVTAPNFSDGANPTITYSNPVGTSATSLQVGIFNDAGGASYVPYREISKTGTSYTFQLTDAERENLRRACTDSNSIPVRYFIRTVIGGNTYLHNLQRTFSISDANPIITASVMDVNAATIGLTGNSQKLIKYYSNAKATMHAEPQKGATIDERDCVVENSGYAIYGTEYTFYKVESNVFNFSATDSRGNPASKTIYPEMVNYVKLTCNIANNTPDALGNMTVVCSGNYYNGSFGAKTNSLTVQYRYKTYGGSFGDWHDMAYTLSGNTYFASVSITIPDFEQEQIYFFEARAGDLLDIIISNESAVMSKPIFHWGKNDFVFEVPVTFNAGTEGASNEGDQTIDGNLNVTGNIRLKGSGNYGNTLLFGDGTYCYITEPKDDEMYIKAKRIDLDANGVYVYGNPIPTLEKGVWSPSLNSSAVSSYTTQYGWYSKMGQTVSVGFYIKANCNSGYNSTSISISGLPFTPMFAAAGGGMCSGAYVSAGFDFQCFVAETSGYITTRVQSCNHTSAGNLSTSSSGCFYRSGGGELTLSGTITFMSTT